MGRTRLIGDYVHYRGQNYLDHAITMRGGTKAENSASYITTAYSKQMASIKQKINRNKIVKTDLKEIEDTISAFMVEPKRKNSRLAKIQDWVRKEVYKQLQDTVGDMNNVDFLSATLKNASTKGKIGGIKAHRKYGRTGALVLDLKEVTTKVTKLEEQYLDIISKNKADLKLLKNIKKQYRDLVKKTVKQVKNSKNFPDMTDIIESSNSKDITRLRDSLNTLIEKYAAYPAKALAEGVLFEDFIIASAVAAKKVALDSIDEGFKRMNVGGDTKLKSAGSDELYTQRIRNVGDYSQVKTTFNQRNKVDVSLTWKSTGEKLKMSAKNVTFDEEGKATWVDVLSGSPLMTMLEQLSPLLVNHFLNIHAIHHDKTQSKIDNVEKTMKLDDKIKNYLFLKGLTGYSKSEKGEMANLLVVNDKTKKNSVRVYDMQAVLEEGKNNLQAISVGVGFNKTGKVNIRDLKLKNDYSEAGYQVRIADMVGLAHRYKVYISFNAETILKNI